MSFLQLAPFLIIALTINGALLAYMMRVEHRLTYIETKLENTR